MEGIRTNYIIIIIQNYSNEVKAYAKKKANLLNSQELDINNGEIVNVTSSEESL